MTQIIGSDMLPLFIKSPPLGFKRDSYFYLGLNLFTVVFLYEAERFGGEMR